MDGLLPPGAMLLLFFCKPRPGFTSGAGAGYQPIVDFGLSQVSAIHMEKQSCGCAVCSISQLRSPTGIWLQRQLSTTCYGFIRISLVYRLSPGVLPVFLLFFFLVVLAFCFSSQMETPAILQAYFNRRSSASRNLPNPRSLELSYGQSQCKYRKQSQCKYRKTTAGNLTKRHTLANARSPHHIRATSSNRSSSYRPE